MLKVSLHRIGRTDVVLFFAAVSEIENTTMFEEAPDNTDDTDVFGQTGNPWTQAARITHDEINPHARPRGVVKGPRNVGIFQSIELKLNESRLLPTMDVDFSSYLSEQRSL